MPKSTKVFQQGNQIAAKAALMAGATSFFGYPITPSSEIFETWVQIVGDLDKPNKSPVNQETLQYLQCEDEMASGFAMIGACMAGKKAFTATAGPGNVLMQDAFSAAEALRIPTVALIIQRGGLSTSTVIYSQEEVTLTALGGNGEGFRFVYSPSNLQQLYDFTIEAFNMAWKYRYPTFVLADGYQGKMQGEVELHPMEKNMEVKPKPILLKNQGTSNWQPQNLRNCYDQEEEIYEIIEDYRQDFENISPEVARSNSYQTEDADIIIISHGIVASAATVAVDHLRRENIKVGLWQPETLRPIDKNSLLQAVKDKQEIIFVESALGQLARLVNNTLAHQPDFKDDVKKSSLYKPALGITPDDIFKFVSSK
jgi:2-oxoglutarate ferredoxin oxidoreductase subunit alpha